MGCYTFLEANKKRYRVYTVKKNKNTHTHTHRSWGLSIYARTTAPYSSSFNALIQPILDYFIFVWESHKQTLTNKTKFLKREL